VAIVHAFDNLAPQPLLRLRSRHLHTLRCSREPSLPRKFTFADPAKILDLGYWGATEQKGRLSSFGIDGLRLHGVITAGSHYYAA
jgi:hypothetical protein